MKELKAIPTLYKGIEFRSRLEARWAVFFDACGLDWDYEPEGFILPDGSWYLPDFLIHNAENALGALGSKLWIEIKGDLKEADIQRIDLFSGGRQIELKRPLTKDEIRRLPKCRSIDVASDGKTYLEIYPERPTLILGPLPKGDGASELFADALGYSRTRRDEEFSFCFITGDDFGALPVIDKNGKFELVSTIPDLIECDLALTQGAYRQALSAKFERKGE